MSRLRAKTARSHLFELTICCFRRKPLSSVTPKILTFRRLAARRIPQQLIAWVDNFCSERTATITVFFFFFPYFPSSIYPQQLTKMQRPFGYKEAI